jgi:hypothetical protein
MADGASDGARSIYLKLTGALDSNCTVTLSPNTVSKVWMIENATTDSGSSGPYSVIIKQGTGGGASVSITNGQVKMIATDGGGTGGIVYDLLTDVELAGTTTATALTVDDVAIDGKVITMTGSSGDTATMTVGANGVLAITTTDGTGTSANITITADGTFEAAGTTVTLNSSGGITLDADGGTVTFADDGASLGTITSSGYSGTAAVATAVTVTANNSTAETIFPVFVDGATGTQGIETDTGLTYNPSTGLLTATGFTGNLTGTLQTAAQTNVTSLGTLSSLAVSGEITGAGFTGTLDGILGSGTAAAATVTTLNTSDAVNLNLTTDSTSSTSGALIVDGGVGVAKKLFVGTDFDVSNNAVIDGTALVTGVLTTTATQVATGGITSGSNIVSDTDSTDDLGTNSVRWANLYVDAITATDQITATGFTGTLDGILGSGSAAAATVTTLDTSGAVNLNLTTDSTSSTSGALIVDGGVGIAKKLFVGTDLDVDGTTNLDNTDIDGTLVVDGSNISLDSTTTLNIDNSNASNGITIGTATSGVPISIGHGTSETTVNDNLTVTGNLTINGTTTTVNSTTVTVDDPIFTLGGDSAPGSDDNKDRGIEFRYHDGSSARIGFFGYDDSASAFTFLTAASNSSEVFSGTAGNLAGVGTIGSGAITSTGAVQGTSLVVANDGNIGSAGDSDSMAISSSGVVTFSQAPVFPDGSINIADLDIDGGTDINAAIVDADLFIVDDGAGGTNRKTTASRMKSYFQSNVTASEIAADDIVAGDAAVTIGNGSTSADITIDSGDDIVLDAAGGNIEFKDGGTLQLTLDMDGTAGAQVIQLGVDSDDLIFKQYDGTTVLTLDDDTTVKVATDLTVGDDLGLVSDSAVLSFGADSEVTLTHVHNDGLLLNADNQLQFRDSAINIRSDADGDLDINANDEIELNSTLIDINGNVEISGTLAQTGIATFTDDIIIGDGKTIGSASDTDAMTIASNGQVTFTQTLIGTALDISGNADIDGDLTVSSAAVKVAGKETIWVPAAAMYPSTTNGCSALTQVETTAGRPDLKCLDFATGADDFAQFSIAFPKSWNEGTITFQPFWTVTGTNTGTVAWGLAGVASSNDDTINIAFGTVVVTTAKAHSGTSNDLMVSDASGAVTIAGSPAADDLCFFQVSRDVSADDQSGDARLLGIKLFFTTDAANDA